MHGYLSTTLFALVIISSIVSARPAAAIDIPTVPVGNPGNPGDFEFSPDTGGRAGAVANVYRIGTTEVTVGQYTTFLNAVAKTDTYELYNAAMATDLNIAGIARSGAPGSYSYSVIGSPNKPVTYVGWGDAARFSNWLNNGQPTGAQNAATTEAGAYDLNGAVSNGALLAVSRNANATWFLPTNDEWYKAAYYQPAAEGGDVDGYWKYATQSNTFPTSAPPPGSPGVQTNIANIRTLSTGAYAVTGSGVYDPNQNYLTDVGAYSSAKSFYGTYDQLGNVWEWTETAWADMSPTPFFRILRGDSWATSNYRFLSNYSPTFESSDFGFRVASVPEPGTAVLAAVACGMLFWAKTRRQWR